MRDLLVVGLDSDGRHVVCESVGEAADTFRLPVDDRLRAAIRGDKAATEQTQIAIEVTSALRPRDIQSRIRAGASVEQLAKQAGVGVSRIERFAHPVLLERARAAELATAAHPVLADGPAVLTLLEVVTSALISRGLNPDATSWDSWRNEDGRWTVQLVWKAGRSENVAHFRYVPGAHGGTVTAVDDPANELINPNFDRPLRAVAPVAQLGFDDELPAPAPAPAPVVAAPAASVPVPAPAKKTGRKAKPAIPAWEDVLLGVRSSGDR